jgi:hypothetical protein
MRFVLEEESKGKKMVNVPIHHKNKTARDIAALSP